MGNIGNTVPIIVDITACRRLTDVRLDDLYLYTDSDEIPKPELLQFLRLYDGLPHLLSFR